MSPSQILMLIKKNICCWYQFQNMSNDLKKKIHIKLWGVKKEKNVTNKYINDKRLSILKHLINGTLCDK